MILVQYDYEFEKRFIRIIKLIDYKLNNRYLSAKKYKVLAEFYDDGGNAKVKDIVSGDLPRNSIIVKDEEAYVSIFNKIFNEYYDWPELRFK